MTMTDSDKAAVLRTIGKSLTTVTLLCPGCSWPAMLEMPRRGHDFVDTILPCCNEWKARTFRIADQYAGGSIAAVRFAPLPIAQKPIPIRAIRATRAKRAKKSSERKDLT